MDKKWIESYFKLISNKSISPRILVDISQPLWVHRPLPYFLIFSKENFLRWLIWFANSTVAELGKSFMILLSLLYLIYLLFAFGHVSFLIILELCNFIFCFSVNVLQIPLTSFPMDFPLWFMLLPTETFQTARLSNVLSFVLVGCPGLQPALWALCQLGHKSFSMFDVRCCQAAKKKFDSGRDGNNVVTFNENLWFFISTFR